MIHAMRAYRSIFHTKLVPMVYLGVKQGWLHQESLKTVTKKLKVSVKMGESQRASMAQGNACVNNLFKAHHGSLPIVTLFKLEPNTIHLQDTILVFGKPIEDWHSHQNKTVRSCKGAREWFLEECSGKFMEPLCMVMSTFSDPGKLQQCGFTVHAHDLPLAGLHAKHPLVQEEHERALVAGAFGLELVGARLCRFLWALEGWPSKSICFSHENDSIRAQLVNKFAQDHENDTVLAKEGGEFWKAVADRSVFRTTPVLQIAAILEETGGIATPAVQDHHSKKYSGLLASQVNEDGFQRERRAQANTQNGHMTPQAAWEVLLDKEVVAKVHHFDHIPLGTAPIARGSDCLLPKSTYHPSPAQVSTNCDLKGIRRPDGDWFTCTPESGNAPFVDIKLRDHVIKRGRAAIDKGSMCWLSVLFQISGLIVRAVPDPAPVVPGPALAGPPPQPLWFFSLGSVASTSGLGWPAEQIKERRIYVPDCNPSYSAMHMVNFMIMLDENEYEAMCYEWRSPITLVLDKSPRRGLFAHILRGPLPLKKAAAYMCFGALPRTTLYKLSQHWHCECRKSDGVMRLLRALLGHCLPECSEEEVLDILTQRELKKSYLEELVEVEDFTDLYSLADQKLIENDATQAKEGKADRRQFKKELAEMRKAHRTKVLATPKMKCRRRARFKNPISRDDSKRLPTNVPPGTLEREEVLSMAPPLAFVWHDTFNARWLVSLEGWRKSRSWLKYGHRGSAMIVLAKAWLRYMEVRRFLLQWGY